MEKIYYHHNCMHFDNCDNKNTGETVTNVACSNYKESRVNVDTTSIALDEIDKVADKIIEQLRNTINDDEKTKNFLYISEARHNLEKLSTLLVAKIAITNGPHDREKED